MSDRPNFLFIITDQHKCDHLGCYGNPIVRTPNIDGLSKSGLTFDRFYAASPICMPNRATLMTGRMPSNTGVRFNGVPLATDHVTFVELLRAAGYRTGLVGGVEAITGDKALGNNLRKCSGAANGVSLRNTIDYTVVGGHGR